MKKEEEIVYIIRSGKIIKHKKTTTEWEKAKNLLKEAAEKTKDNIAYLDYSFGPFTIAYAVFSKQKVKQKTNLPLSFDNPTFSFNNPIYIDDINKLKKPKVQKTTGIKFEDIIKTMFYKNNK